MSKIQDPSRFLRYALRGNAIFSALSAVLFLAGSAAVAGFVGALGAADVSRLGVQLAVFAIWLTWLSRRPEIPRWQVWTVVTLDALWVVGSLAALLAPPAGLTTGGKIGIAAVALVVADFAVLQALGARKLQKVDLALGAVS